MEKLIVHFGSSQVEVCLPIKCAHLSMTSAATLPNVEDAIKNSLRQPIGTESLVEITQKKLALNPAARAVIVVSDNTRPVPYTGEAQILWPIIELLLGEGMDPAQITILVATGTHRAMTQEELKVMLDARVFELGISVLNHDCRDADNLVPVGTTSRGSRIRINRFYQEADLKILTGLVESHFMAGASGGRKSVCPGLIGEEGTFIFHGPRFLASPQARDLVLEGNPCHEEALEVAKMVGVDFIVNVTLDHQFRITGVYAGHLEKAHQAAVEKIRESVSISLKHEYDIVLSHAGYVGINHYQAAKVGVAAIPALKPGGRLLVVADNTDLDPMGSSNYKTMLHLLKLMGPEKFNQLLLSDDWSFVPEQWQVQMWAKLFAKIPFGNFIYYSPQFKDGDYRIMPGTDGRKFLDSSRKLGVLESVSQVIEGALQAIVAQLKVEGNEDVRLAYLADGPYGIPVRLEDKS